MSKRTAEEVCIEYAIAVEAVREQTRIMAQNRCPDESGEECNEHGYVTSPPPSSCLTEFWNEVRSPANAEDHEAFDEMCDACKIRFKAFERRRELKSRLGATKRSIEAVGKRFNKAATISEGGCL